MPGAFSEVPRQILPVTLPCGEVLLGSAVYSYTNFLKPCIYIGNGLQGGWMSLDNVVSSKLAENPGQIGFWYACRDAPPTPTVDIVWSWAIQIIKFPNDAVVSYSPTVFSSFVSPGVNLPSFQFLVTDLITKNRQIIPAGTLAPGDIFNFYFYSNHAHPSNNYTGRRWIEQSIHVYFTQDINPFK